MGLREGKKGGESVSGWPAAGGWPAGRRLDAGGGRRRAAARGGRCRLGQHSSAPPILASLLSVSALSCESSGADFLGGILACGAGRKVGASDAAAGVPPVAPIAPPARPRRPDGGLKGGADISLCKGGEPERTRLETGLPGRRKEKKRSRPGRVRVTWPHLCGVAVAGLRLFTALKALVRNAR